MRKHHLSWGRVATKKGWGGISIRIGVRGWWSGQKVWGWAPKLVILDLSLPRLFYLLVSLKLLASFLLLLERHLILIWKCDLCYRKMEAAAAAKSLQSYPSLCDPVDNSPPGSPIPGILQAGTLEWVVISFSNAWKWKVKVKSLSCVWLLATPWTTAYQVPPSMGFSRQEYWSGMPLPKWKKCR